MTGKIKWLSRGLWQLPFHMVLVTSPRRHTELMDWMKVPVASRDTFPTGGLGKTGGTVSLFENTSRNDMPICVVTITPVPGDPAQVLSKIVHEAVHVWQRAKEIVSKNNEVGDEPEAYAIQYIYDTLVEEYARQVPIAAKPQPSRRAAKRTRRTA